MPNSCLARCRCVYKVRTACSRDSWDFPPYPWATALGRVSEGRSRESTEQRPVALCHVSRE